MRIGIIAFLHESNTFLSQPTTLESFRQNLLLTGEPIRDALQDSHHEVGGFFAGLDEADAEAVPLFAARALPSGTIAAADFQELMNQMLAAVASAGPLDGLLVAPHGATVSAEHADADGRWLNAVRAVMGRATPIIGTLDAHANLSPLMVRSCDALIAYRTNPHLDQKARGQDAARMLVRTVNGEIAPVMSARFPPLAISIERQCTDEPALRPLYEAADAMQQQPGILSNSILLGFPYADVSEMGSSVIVVTDGDQQLADQSATELADLMWNARHQLSGRFTSVVQALDECQNSTDRVCLLDMGDNVGGGSAADGTVLLQALQSRQLGPAFVCLFDPDAVAECRASGIGSVCRFSVGGRTDNLHGEPLDLTVTVRSLHEGRFSEPQPRHGGITEFDQGPTAVCETQDGLTLMLTSRRMVPFSLQQLLSCDVQPEKFRILVAKGVNAPIAAYRDVCDRFIRVNTPGSTCADMAQLTYQHRRRPLFPLEPDAVFNRDDQE